MALQLVGSALLSAFLQVASEKLASPQVKNFFYGSKLDEKLPSKLQIKLHSIQALADDAEQKQFRDQHVRNWLLKVKDVMLDAKDLLDEIQCELSKREDEAEAESESQTCSGCTCKVPNFFKFSPVIKSRMEEVLDSLEILLGEQGPLGLRNASDGAPSGLGSEVSQKPQLTSLPREGVIYGRDDDKKIIFNWLTSETDNDSKLSKQIEQMGNDISKRNDSHSFTPSTLGNEMGNISKRNDSNSFTRAVDNAIRSNTPSIFGDSPVRSCGSLIDSAIRSSSASTTDADFDLSFHTLGLSGPDDFQIQPAPSQQAQAQQDRVASPPPPTNTVNLQQPLLQTEDRLNGVTPPLLPLNTGDQGESHVGERGT